ncbi:MAG TPA: hypothetical protein VGJ15_06030 [Pirellulales bacterium]
MSKFRWFKARHGAAFAACVKPLAVLIGVLILFAIQSNLAQAQMRGLGRMSPRTLGGAGQQFERSPGDLDPTAPPPPDVDGLNPWLRRLHATLPQSAAEFATFNSAPLTEASQAVEQWVMQWSRIAPGQPRSEQLAIVGRLLDAKDFVDRELDDVLLKRTRFAELPADDKRHDALRRYLQATSTLIDLSGRLRTDLLDIVDDTAARMSDQLPLRERMIELLADRHSTIGAEDMVVELFDPAPQENNPTPEATSGPRADQSPTTARGRQAERGAQMARGGQSGMQTPPSGGIAARRLARVAQLQQQQQQLLAAQEPIETPRLSIPQKLKLIQLIATSGDAELVDDLTDFINTEGTPPTLLLAAAEAIQTLGLPQDPRPGQDPALPQPSITAEKLRKKLTGIDANQLKPAERARLEKLMAWLDVRNRKGLDGNTYRLGTLDIQPGDFLLMRNPSPYNLFTDLSPGLFTHVGVAALETGSDGKRRMVIVDLPERGTTMPATNVDTFLQRTLHYVFLRHTDPEVAAKLGAAAADTIGNPTEFDLNFRTDRIAALKGMLLKGEKIHTYCAGFLLVCAQAANQPRDDFFPITETTAGGHTKENIAKLGLSVGDGFVSPTGALFSPKLKLVGHSEPMYDSRREVEETIYNYFADGLEKKVLHPSPDLFQSLRVKMAEAAKSNVVLAQALAATVGVSQQMDLVSAAKAAAVVETLDDIAYGASGDYMAARQSIIDSADLMPEERDKLTQAERDAMTKFRTRHAELATRFDQKQISASTVRIELMNFYISQGRRQLDERFFNGGK